MKQYAQGLLAVHQLTVVIPCAMVVCNVAPSPLLGSPRKTDHDKRIEQLIQQMTLEEKLGQLTQQWGGQVQDVNPVVAQEKQGELFAVVREGQVGSFLGAHGAEYTNRLQRIAVEESSHHIPLIFGNDVIHGYRTIFPIPLGESASWNLELIEQAAHIGAVEARAAGTHWTFAPMVDICRDPRWGRIAEGAGEDPYLGAAIAAARVRGFQGDDLRSNQSVLACAKHFAAYGAAEGGRDYNTVDISRITLRSIYLPPFKAAVDAGVGSLMTSFNEINGIPATGSSHLLTRILRNEWHFDGFIVSDWNSIQEMIPHGFVEDNTAAAVAALSAGVDMDMSSFTFRSHLKEAIAEGKISTELVDRALRRVLHAKADLGLFQNPFADPAREELVTLSQEHRTVAREVARNSFVLLKNEQELLPIGKRVKSLAIIGPLADNKKDPLGTWAGIGKPDDVVTVLDGIKSRAGEAIEVAFARGCDVNGDDRTGFSEAVSAAESADLVVMVVGESENMSGEAHSRASLDLPKVQLELVKAVHKTEKPVIVVLLNGRPMSISWIADNIPAILVAWHPGVECGNAIADVLFGDHNPCGKLPVTFPRHVGQVPTYYAHKNTGRPPTSERYTSKYIDIPWTPLYPFGYGLSYTTFQYSDLELSDTSISQDDTLHVSVNVTNSGGRDGREIVQLYIRDRVASVTQPVRRLRGFESVALEAGQTKKVAFVLNHDDLGYWDEQLQFRVEPGSFQVWVGPNSAEGMEAAFRVQANGDHP